jgi:hypothetical protein
MPCYGKTSGPNIVTLCCGGCRIAAAGIRRPDGHGMPAQRRVAAELGHIPVGHAQRTQVLQQKVQAGVWGQLMYYITDQ